MQVEYPPNVPEIPAELSNNELVRRLKLLAKSLQDMEQDSATNNKYTALANHIASKNFMEHSSREVRIIVACCIADILRMFAPDAPFGDPEHLKEILVFLIRQLRGLDNPNDPHYRLFFYLLENLTVVKSLNVGLELEDNQMILCQLIKHCMAIPNPHFDDKVRQFLLELLQSYMSEIDTVSYGALDTLFQSLIEPFKTQNREAYAMCRELIERCELSLEAYVQNFLTQALLGGAVPDSYVVQSNKVYSLIGELYEIEPKLLNVTLGQLEYRLQTDDDKDRLDVVKLLGRLFASPKSTLADEHPQLWDAFLGRFNDKKPEIRSFCIGKSQELLINRPECRAQISDALLSRLHDFDENVRIQSIQAVTSAAKRSFSSVNDRLFDGLAERIRDKKFPVRKEALVSLGTIYRKVTCGTDFTQSEIESVRWIRNKLLHAYYQSPDDKLLCETLLHTCLVPYQLETKKRMEMLFETYCSIDANAVKSIDEIIKQQSYVRSTMRQILELHKQEENNERGSKIETLLKSLSERFTEAPRTFESLKLFYVFLSENSRAFQLMDSIVGTNYTTDKINEMVKELLAKMSTNKQTQSAVKALLERSAPLMIDIHAIRSLIDKVGDNLDYPSAVCDVSADKVIERSFGLLKTLSLAFPYCFRDQETLGQLVTFLRDGNPIAAEVTIQIFSNVGGELEKEFSSIFGSLMPELLTLAKSGTARQAKYAVRCINEICSGKVVLYKKIIAATKENVDILNPACVNALAALGAVAELSAKEFLEEFKSLVSDVVVLKIILNTSELHSADHGSREWVPESEISKECAAKVAAIKFLVRFLVGLKRNEGGMGESAIKMFTAHIDTNGDVHKSGDIPNAEMSWLRLAAGCAMLKLAQEREFSSLISRKQFRSVAYMINDPCYVVRQKFALKLNKHCLHLSLDYLSIFCLADLVSSNEGPEAKDFRNKIRNCVAINIQRAREQMKRNPKSQDKPHLYMPEYSLAYAVYLLAHFREFKHHKDLQSLRKLREALWSYLDVFVTKEYGNNQGLQFLYRLFQQIKQTKDAESPKDDAQNQKMWAVCDLGMLLLGYRVPNFVIRETQSNPPKLLASYFTTDSDLKKKTNIEVFLPNVILDEEKRKYGKHHQTGGPKLPKPKATADQTIVKPKRGRKRKSSESVSLSPVASPMQNKKPSSKATADETTVKPKRGRKRILSESGSLSPVASPTQNKKPSSKATADETTVKPKRGRKRILSESGSLSPVASPTPNKRPPSPKPADETTVKPKRGRKRKSFKSGSLSPVASPTPNKNPSSGKRGRKPKSGKDNQTGSVKPKPKATVVETILKPKRGRKRKSLESVSSSPVASSTPTKKTSVTSSPTRKVLPRAAAGRKSYK